MNRRGFTLVEVIVALSVGATVMVLAQQVLTTTLDHAEFTAQLHVRVEQVVHPELWMTLLAARVDTEPGKPFRGTATIAEFSSRCETARGWLLPCTVVAAATDSIVVTTSTGIRFVLPGSGGQLRYYVRGDRGGSVLTETESQVAPPSALLLVTDADTMPFPLGVL